MTKRSRTRLIARIQQSGGYTIVELMMAIAVFAIGVSGIIAMQKVAAAANQHSRALSLATNIAQAWQDQLNADSSLFTRNNNTSVWLSLLAGAPQVGWLRPPWNTNLKFGAAFDALGNPIDDTNLANAQFCVHLRLTRVYLNSISPGIEVIRTEVRVIWPRTDGTIVTNFCDAPGTNVPVVGDTQSSNYHFLYQVSAVRQQ
jgi:type IV pilus assembly protein PilV